MGKSSADRSSYSKRLSGWIVGVAVLAAVVLVPPISANATILLQKNFDGLNYFGRFFSTGLRPPPVLRVRSTSTS